MKLIEKQEIVLVSTVMYFGIEFVIPSDYHYIATDANGSVCAYQDEPIADEVPDSNLWCCNEVNNNFIRIGKVDLEGLDWTLTKQFV